MFLDNLVRLTHLTDPDPGDNRSAQVCTLPITIKGVPRDTAILDSWHDPLQCDSTDTCPCKKETNLTNEDLEITLTQLNKEETDVILRYRQLCTWCFQIRWDQIDKGVLKSVIDRAVQNETESHETIENVVDALDISLHSLKLADDQIPDEENENVVDNLDISLHSLKLADDHHEEEYTPSHVPDKIAGDKDMGSDEDEPSSFYEAIEESGAFYEAIERESDYSSENGQSSDEENQLSDMSGLDVEVDEFFEWCQPLDVSGIANESENKVLPETINMKETTTLPSELHDRSLGEVAAMGQVPGPSSESSSISDNEMTSEKPNICSLFGFQRYTPPTTMCRHPPAFTGRDDDKNKLREILDEVLVKCAHPTTIGGDRILFAPDHKIAKNLLQLIKENEKYRVFLPEFPLLHLRKSKINTLGSAYKDAGLKQLLKFMKDDQKESDWAKLVTAQHIDSATRIVRRLSLSLHLAFLIQFMSHLAPSEAMSLRHDMHVKDPATLHEKWAERFMDFLKKGYKANATFALHKEMMDHCDEVGAISLAERMGGKQGYTLLLASVKSSLPFSFLNGASAYATFCTQLLHEHGQAGTFHRNLKEALFTTPYKGSTSNFALDTQREMDHKDALKAFRPGASTKSVLPRMACVDTLNKIHEQRLGYIAGATASKDVTVKSTYIGWQLTDTDLNHILPTASLILRRGGLSLVSDDVAKQVYSKETKALPDAVLDRNTMDIGIFLIKKYVCTQGMFGLSASDIPDITKVGGPNPLLGKVKRSKSVTIKRITGKQNVIKPSERQVKEVQRQRKVTREKKVVDCLSSEMNTCQSVVKPDCSKPGVQKSRTIKLALANLLDTATADVLESREGLTYQDLQSMPISDKQTIKAVTVEFAGVKFGTRAVSGDEYIKHIEHATIHRLLSSLPCVKRIVICEEKYRYTPDDLKAATRAKRGKNDGKSVSHLKTAQEILAAKKFDRHAVISTAEGKNIISTYLAANASKLNVFKDIILDIDSEWHIEGCSCDTEICSCSTYSVPLRCKFSKAEGFMQQHLLADIQQRKGEAEMAQVDWLVDCELDLQKGDSVLSLVTSGDIDAIVIHLFTLSHMWKRAADGTFLTPVYILLQRPGTVYNVTAMIQVLERYFQERFVAMKIALALCLGGNDFIPKFYGYSHDKVLKLFTQSKPFLERLFKFDRNSAGILTEGRVNLPVYQDFVKHLYCPPTCDPQKLTMQEVRQLSIKAPGQKVHKNPQTWMPPASAIEMLGKLNECQLEYMMTAGSPSAPLPDFLAKGCLRKSGEGVEYNLGLDSHIENWMDLVPINDADLKIRLKEAKLKQSRKRKPLDTPQKGARRKQKAVPTTSTPKKKAEGQSENCEQ